jgi:hypothetical protein
VVSQVVLFDHGTLDLLQPGEELGRAVLARRQAAEIFEQLRASIGGRSAGN